MTEVLSFPLTAMGLAMLAVLIVPADRRLLSGISAAACGMPALALVHGLLSGGSLAGPAGGAAGGAWPFAWRGELTPLSTVLVILHGLVFVSAALRAAPAASSPRTHHLLLIFLHAADIGALTSTTNVTFSTWLLTAMVTLGYLALLGAPAHRRDGLVALSGSLALGALLLLFAAVADPPGAAGPPRWMAVVALVGLMLVAPVFPLHVWVKQGFDETRGAAALLVAWLPTSLAVLGGWRWYVTGITSTVPGWTPILATLFGATALVAALTLRARPGAAHAMGATSHVFGSLALLGALAGGAIGGRAVVLLLAGHALTLPLLAGSGRDGGIAWRFACRASAAALPFSALFPGVLLLFMGLVPAISQGPALGAALAMALAALALVATFHLQQGSRPAEAAVEGEDEPWWPLTVALWVLGLSLGTAPSLWLSWMGSGPR